MALSFPVVGVGASAGGVPALQSLFSALPASTGLAFVVVQHLSPTHESQLVQLLQSVTRLAVREAVNGVAVERDHVYVIAPGQALTIGYGMLWSRPRLRSQTGQLERIDAFFEALASEQGDSAVGVVLTGTGSDGARGAVMIKRAGGIVFAQDPATAQHDGMPCATIATGSADRVLSIEALARALIQYATRGAPANDDCEALRKQLLLANGQLSDTRSELSAVSQRLQGTIAELALQRGVLGSGVVMALFLDEQLCVRWFAPAMRRLFPLLPADVGRPLADLVPRFSDPCLLDDVRHVLAGGEPRRSEVQSRDGNWYERRVRSHEHTPSEPAGVVVTFDDVTARHAEGTGTALAELGARGDAMTQPKLDPPRPPARGKLPQKPSPASGGDAGDSIRENETEEAQPPPPRPDETSET